MTDNYFIYFSRLVSMAPRAFIGTVRFPGNFIPYQNLILFCQKITWGSVMNALRAGLWETLVAFGA